MKHKAIKCEWNDFCTTCDNIKDKQPTCFACKYYRIRMIDGEFGYCIFSPKPYIVPWCRDICAQFQEVKDV